MKLYIPKPCHEDWSKMTPEAQGRFCAACEKMVVDFTSWSTADIQNYFAKHYHSKICGRFKQDQLTKPVEIIISRQDIYSAPRTRHFLLALLIIFGTTLFSCTDQSGNRQPIGEIMVVDSPKVDTSTAIAIPTDDIELSGEVAYPEPAIQTSPANEITISQTIPSTHTKGFTVMEPPPPILPPLPEIPEILMGDTIAPPVEDSTEHLIVSMMDPKPSFPGGSGEMLGFIKDHLVYPNTQASYEGKVVLQFVVDTNGNLKNIEVLKSLAPEFDKAAIDVVKKMPQWIPGMRFGRKAEIRMVLPINFTR